MRPDDFYLDDDRPDPFGLAVQQLDMDLIDRIRRAPLPERADIEVAVPLTRLIHDDLERFGTDGGHLGERAARPGGRTGHVLSCRD